VEVGLADPHPMQNACELARNGDDRAQQVRPLGDPQAPRAQGGPCSDAQQKACSRLAKHLPNGDITLLGDTGFIVDGGSGLMSSRGQSKMRADRSRSRKAPRVIDIDFERQLGQLRWLDRHRRQSHMYRIGDRWPDTLATHQPPQIEAVRPNKKRHRVRAALDAAHLSAKRNGTSRRGKPWRLLRTHRLRYDDIRRAAAAKEEWSPASLYLKMKERWSAADRSWPVNGEAVIRNTLEIHCPTCACYDGGPKVFMHIDRGVWALSAASAAN